MKNLEMNTVISWGLVIMGVGAVAGWIWISIKTGTSSGTEVPISIISGLVGVLTGKNMVEKLKQKEMPQHIPEYPTTKISNRSKSYEELSDEDKRKVDDMIKKVLGEDNN